MKNKDKLIRNIRNILLTREEILFAYLHGSFLEENTFNDIDIGIYLKYLPSSIIKYELSLETELMNKIRGYIFDVRILNNAPLSFRYNVIKSGEILLSHDEDKRTEFQEQTVINYLDFLPYRKRYLKEVLSD